MITARADLPDAQLPSHLCDDIVRLGLVAGRWRDWGRVACRLGLIMIGAWIAFGGYHPASSNLFFFNYVAIPAELNSVLPHDGVMISTVRDSYISNGASWFEPIGLVLILTVVSHIALARFVPQIKGSGPWILTRIVMLVLLSLTSINWQPGTGQMAPVSRYWTIVEDAELRPVPKPNTSMTFEDGADMVRSVDAAGRVHWSNVPKQFVTPIYLDPVAQPPLLADQARYVFAQAAYLRGDPIGTAAHLRKLSATWMPADWHTRSRIGVLGHWAEEHGADPRSVPARIARGAPFNRERYVIGLWVLWIGLFLAGAGLWLVVLSQRLLLKRQTYATRLEKVC